jgi:DNA-binding HxlR family transcriptional regulator
MSLPIPGWPVRGSKTGKPIMALLDLLGRTWALGIIWQLQQESLSFSELQVRCENISPTLLTNRLKELQQTKLVEKSLQGYQLTAIGSALFQVISPLGQWSKQWQLLFDEQQSNKGNEYE